MTIAQDEANPPLIVNPNRMLAFAVAPQGFQLVSRRRRQHPQFRRGVQLQEFAKRNALKGSKPPRMLVVKKLLGFLRREALDHPSRV